MFKTLSFAAEDQRGEPTISRTIMAVVVVVVIIIIMVVVVVVVVVVSTIALIVAFPCTVIVFVLRILPSIIGGVARTLGLNSCVRCFEALVSSETLG